MPVSSSGLALLLVAGSVEYRYLDKRRCLTVDANERRARGKKRPVQRAHEATRSFNRARIYTMPSLPFRSSMDSEGAVIIPF